MNFRTNYRPKLPRNKYGALTKNIFSRYTSGTATFNLRNTAGEPNEVPINYEPFKPPIVFNEEIEEVGVTHIEELNDQGNIIIETE